MDEEEGDCMTKVELDSEGTLICSKHNKELDYIEPNMGGGGIYCSLCKEESRQKNK